MKKLSTLFLSIFQIIILTSCKKDAKDFIIDNEEKLVNALKSNDNNLRLDGKIKLEKVTQSGGEDEKSEVVKENQMSVAYSNGLFYLKDLFSDVFKECYYRKDKKTNKVIEETISLQNVVTGSYTDLDFKDFENPFASLSKDDYKQQKGWLKFYINDTEKKKYVLNNLKCPITDYKNCKCSVETDKENNIYFRAISSDFDYKYKDSLNNEIKFKARYDAFYTIDTTISQAYVLEPYTYTKEHDPLALALDQVKNMNYTIYRSKTTIDSSSKESEAETIARIKYDKKAYADFVNKKGLAFREKKVSSDPPSDYFNFTFDEFNTLVWTTLEDRYKYDNNIYLFRPYFESSKAEYFTPISDTCFYMSNLNFVKVNARNMSIGYINDEKKQMYDTCYYLELNLYQGSLYSITYKCLEDGKLVNYYDIYKDINKTTLNEFSNYFSI